MAVAQHFGVVIGFDHQMTGLPDIVVGAGRYGSGVCGDDERCSGTFDEETGVVGSVVACLECRDCHRAYGERKFLIYRCVVVFYAARHAVAPQQSCKSLGGGVETHVLEAPGDRIGISDMIAVIVCEKYALYCGRIYAVCRQFGQNAVVVASGVNENATRRSADIGAVSAASAAERHEPKFFG